MYNTKAYQVTIILILILASISCKKDKTPETKGETLTQWQEMVGSYKVYDTSGVFLYDMSISHTRNEVQNRDTMHFIAFDSVFVFSALQLSSNNESQPNYVRFGLHDPLFDNNNKRWKIMDGGDSLNYSRFYNDTLVMHFKKTNINYYLLDLTPYFYCDCKQIAVKQN